MKKTCLSALLVAIVFSAGCKKKVEISGEIKEITEWGNPAPSISVEEMKAAGFDYADLLEVKFENLGTFVMPFTTTYTEVGVGGLSLCDYLAKGTDFYFSLCQTNFAQRIGGKVGEKFTITLKKKGGFMDTYKKVKSVYTFNREDYASDEIFANFREITTTGMAPKRVYRSGNPFNFKKNAVRYSYVDKLAEQVGIQTEINISDTKEGMEKLMASEGFLSTYCPTLFKNGKVIGLGMGYDLFCPDTYEKVAKGIRFMISDKVKPPFLIHCNEGKDRCGFFAMLLEATAGASYEEIRKDYMTTYMNLYKFEENSDSYNTVWLLNGARFLLLMDNPDLLNNLKNVDWNKMDASKIVPLEASKKYIMQYCGVTQEEYDKLKDLLTKEL